MTNAVNLSALGSNGGITSPTWTTATRPASPVTGQMGYNSSFGAIEFYNGSSWVFSSTVPTIAGSYLIVAGGGGGSSNAGGSGGGGGGGGGAVEASYSFNIGTTYTVTVGAGGNADGTGTSSSISVIGETATSSVAVTLQTGGASYKKISGTTTSYTGGTGGGSGGGSPGADQRVGRAG